MTKTQRKTQRKPRPKPLGTIWEVPDALWETILPILLEFWPRKPTGRRHADWRAALNGIIFRMRSQPAGGQGQGQGDIPEGQGTSGLRTPSSKVA